MLGCLSTRLLGFFRNVLQSVKYIHPSHHDTSGAGNITFNYVNEKMLFDCTKFLHDVFTVCSIVRAVECFPLPSGFEEFGPMSGL